MSIRSRKKGLENRLSRVLATVGICSAALAVAVPAASADFAVSELGVSTSVEGMSSRQAGAHADFQTYLRFSGSESPRTIAVDLPPGLVGNPTAVPECPAGAIFEGPQDSSLCPVSSQVGTLALTNLAGEPMFVAPVFNVEPPVGLPALFAVNFAGALIWIEPHVRPLDYGITATVRSVSEGLPFSSSLLTMWAVPASPSHDQERNGSVDSPPASFLTNPTSCSGTPSRFEVESDSWQNPDVFFTTTANADPEGTPFVWDGCERLPFAPTVDSKPGSIRASSPSGLQFDLAVPQEDQPDGFASAAVRKVQVRFPVGMSISPSSAAGVGSCAPEEIGLSSEAAPTCPDSSRLGTVTVETPLLDEPLDGDVYLAKQGDNPFDSLLAMYLVLRGPGVLIKLPGKVDLDPATGQVTATVDNAPQVPFEHLRMSLRGGPFAPLQTPDRCGTYGTEVEITSWASDEPVELSSPMKITENCDSGGFSPKLRAGTANPNGGSSSPFTLQVTRQDGEQNLAALDVTLPEGLLAKLAGVPLCGDAQAASGECPAASQIGRTTVGAGPGSNPIYVPEAGKAPTAIYLAGPYKGAPYSLVVKVPAQAGPFDLGTVAVRSGISIDPVTAQASVKSDPLPQILQGIPIAYRDVRVEVDRAGFIQNPTSCEAMKVESTLFGSAGATARPSANFTASNCDSLGFKPKLKIAFKGKTHRSAHPALKATLTMPKGGANIGKAIVLLPETEFIDNAHISNPCTRVQFDAGACPKGSILGAATAYTPLLDQPLTGPVYFRSNGGARELPDLVADLNGPIHVTLVGFIDSVKTGPETARVRTRFLGVPDAPVSKFVLNMKGGDKGLIVNNTELCKAKPRAKVQLTGQNGKSSVSNPLVKLGCGKRK